MNLHLKKLFAVFASFIVLHSANAIDLQNKIPANAMYVVSINGQNLLNKMPVEELGKLSVINAFCKILTGDSNKVKITELGVNLASSSYFFVEMTDSIIYFSYLFPLSDAAKFEKGFSRGSEVLKNKDGSRCIKKSNTLLSWNNEYGIYTYASVVDAYFTKHGSIYRRYGFESDEEDYNEESYYNYNDYNEIAVVDSAVVAPYDYMDTMAVAVDTVAYVTDDDYDDVAVDSVAVDTTESYEPYNPDDYYNPEPYNYYDTWSIKRARRDTIAMIWMNLKAAQIFSLKPNESISTNVKFQKTQDKSAEASFWLGSNNKIWTSMLSSFYGHSSRNPFKEISKDSPLFSDENYLTANLHCNATNIKIDMTSYMDPRLTKSVSKISKAKANKKFFKYIPGQNLLGYYSFAYNTQAMLEETPKIMKPYMDMFPMYKGLAGDIIDLYSLLLDEKAIGKLIKGDGIFAVTNLVNKEIEYSSYQYDSSYNYVEIKKTKTETFPEFVFMYSTEDPATTDKIIGMFYKTGVIKFMEGGYYESPLYYGSPFKLYIIQKDGIVFFCNTQQQLEIILKGKVENGLSKDHKKAISGNVIDVFVDIRKILERIPNQDGNKADMLNYGRENVKQLSIAQAKPKGNTTKSEVTLSIPAGKDNSVQYLFHMINEFYMIGLNEE